VVAKIYDGDKGNVAWQGMRALWQSGLKSTGVAIAEPLAFVPDLHLLLQRAIGEETNLKKAIRDAVEVDTTAHHGVLSRRLAATAAGLAALHACGVSWGELRTWQDELNDTRGVLDSIAAVVPDVAGAAEHVLDQLRRIAAANPADHAGPVHGSFRPDQVLLRGSGVGIIDFDDFCQAEPALDLALFRTTVQQLGRKPQQTPLLARIADEFLAEYTRHRQVSRVRVALWESLALLKRVLNCWTKVHPDKLPAAVAALESQLAAEPLRLSL
jgi:aminoglycoside phosphotransferase (APT) family kinase protein